MRKNICISSPFEDSGTTAAAVNLASGIAVLEHRSLLLDFDPACTAICAVYSEPFYCSHTPGLPVTAPSRLREAILPTALEFLHCIPASVLGFNVLQNTQRTETENKIKTIGDKISQRLEFICADFEFIVMHIPSSLDMNAFTDILELDRLLVPVAYNRLKSETAGAASGRPARFFSEIKKKNGQFQTEILVTMSPCGLSEIKIGKSAEAVVYGYPVLSPSIPRDDASRKAPLLGESVFVFDITSPSAEAYLELSAGLVETAVISPDRSMKKQGFFRNGDIVYKKLIIDAKSEMIRRLSAGINIDALKAELLKTYGTNCNERLKFLGGDFVIHDGAPAFRLDFQYSGLWSLIIGADGDIISIFENFSRHEDKPAYISENTLKEKSMAKKLAEIMAEINK